MLRRVHRAVTLSVVTAPGQVTQSLIVARRSETRDAPLLVALLRLPRLSHSLTRTLYASSVYLPPLAPRRLVQLVL